MSKPPAREIAEALAWVDNYGTKNCRVRPSPQGTLMTPTLAELQRLARLFQAVDKSGSARDAYARYAELRVALDSLSAAPDVVEQGWRNPSVDMPEEEQRVDIWIIHPNWTGRITDSHWQKDGGWYDPDGGYGNGAFLKEDTIVVAWMSLPTPPIDQEPS